MNTDAIRTVVKEKYSQAALRARRGGTSACCGGAAGAEACCDPMTSNLHDASQARDVPASARGRHVEARLRAKRFGGAAFACIRERRLASPPGFEPGSWP